jgi:hypothetical protein
MVANGSMKGIELNMNSLGVINGIIDEYTQGQTATVCKEYTC